MKVNKIDTDKSSTVTSGEAKPRCFSSRETDLNKICQSESGLEINTATAFKTLHQSTNNQRV